MSSLLDAENTLHSALDFAQLIVMAGQSLQSDARGPIMRAGDAVREEIEKAIALINAADPQRTTGGNRNG